MSTLPVEKAVSGMSPSPWLCGMTNVDAGIAVVVHDGMLTLKMRRQRPSWMTTGMLLPAGTFVSVKVPLNAVVVSTSGLPVTSAPHWLHATPG